jgi:predicted permease
MRLQNWLYTIPLRLRSLFRRSQVERELQDELSDHIERLTRENMGRGLAQDEARRRALLAMDGVERSKEECRDVWHGVFWDHLAQDMLYAARTFRRSPGFTAVAVATLALGIGANTAVFSAVYTLLLKPLPYPNPDRLVYLWARQPARGIPELPLSIPDYFDFKKQLKSFDAIAGYWGREYAISGVSDPKRVFAMTVFSDYFKVLKLQPTAGRALDTGDQVWGHHNVVVISGTLWKSMFGADPAIVGRTIAMDSEPYVIVGVMPLAATALNPKVQMWTPAAVPPNIQLRRIDRFMRVIGRIKPGISSETAAAELATSMAGLAAAYQEDGGISTYLVPAQNQITSAETRRELLVLLGAVGMLLLIACVNIANLVSVRSVGREREFAVRAALGALRGRLVRQLATEHLLLAFAGGIVAIGFAYWAVSELRVVASRQVPRAALIAVDVPVLLFAVVLTILTALLFGVLPAWKASRFELHGTLQQGIRMASSRRGTRSRKVLIVVETALSLALLICAGLLINSFLRLRAVDPGFSTERTLVAEVDLPDVHYQQPERRIEFISSLLARASQLPGVSSVGATETLPLHPGNQTWTGFEREGFPSGGPDKMPTVTFAHVTPGYFATMRIPVVSGREFSDHDAPKSQPVAIISEALRRRFFPNEDPLGAHIRLGTDGSEAWLTVVGVVGDVSLGALDRPQPPYVYTPVSQGVHGVPNDVLVVLHTQADPLSVASALRAQVQELDRSLALADLTTLSNDVSNSLEQPRFTVTLMVLFAAAAVLLAAIGIYAVLAYVVSQRTKEIGIRLALGATASEVARLVVGEGLRTTALGLAIGIVLALAASRALATLLFHVAALDPKTYAAATVLLLAIAALASLLPALRASRTDPMIALRDE